MDKKKDTPAEVETVTVTMSRPVAEAVQAACEMYPVSYTHLTLPTILRV